jgi:hypothetical protein
MTIYFRLFPYDFGMGQTVLQAEIDRIEKMLYRYVFIGADIHGTAWIVDRGLSQDLIEPGCGHGGPVDKVVTVFLDIDDGFLGPRDQRLSFARIGQIHRDRTFFFGESGCDEEENQQLKYDIDQRHDAERSECRPFFYLNRHAN